jgi:hypothetical protein
MTGGQDMTCPECGETAINQPPIDDVPWEAHGLARPEWSHRDRSSLCPVIGPSGGYEPARPQQRQPGTDTRTMRLSPPAGMRLPARGEPARQPTRQAGERRTYPVRSVGREYMNRVTARLGEFHRQATVREPEADA